MIISNQKYPLLGVINKMKNGAYPEGAIMNFEFSCKFDTGEEPNNFAPLISMALISGKFLVFSKEIMTAISSNELRMLNNDDWFIPHEKMQGEYIIALSSYQYLLYTCIYRDDKYYFTVHEIRSGVIVCTSMMIMDSSGKVIVRPLSSIPNEPSDIDHKKSAIDMFLLAVSFILFKCFAKIETVELDKINRSKMFNGKKYANQTKSNVTIIDSTWYTNLVQTAGFSVRGHFAFRSCGKGRKDRRLVYISPYKKTGYTRTAKILTD